MLSRALIFWFSIAECAKMVPPLGHISYCWIQEKRYSSLKKHTHTNTPKTQHNEMKENEWEWKQNKKKHWETSVTNLFPFSTGKMLLDSMPMMGFFLFHVKHKRNAFPHISTQKKKHLLNISFAFFSLITSFFTLHNTIKLSFEVNWSGNSRQKGTFTEMNFHLPLLAFWQIVISTVVRFGDAKHFASLVDCFSIILILK